MGAYSFVNFIKADSIENAMRQWRCRWNFDSYSNFDECDSEYDESYDDNYEMKAFSYQEVKAPHHVTTTPLDQERVRSWCTSMVEENVNLKWRPAQISSLGGGEFVVFGMMIE
jgi:hypothetical protein